MIIKARYSPGGSLAIVLALLLLNAASGPDAEAQVQPKGAGITAPGLQVGNRGLERFVRLLRSGSSGLAGSRGVSWQVWWELNKDVYLGLARRAEFRKKEKSDRESPFVGRKTGPDPARRPFGGDLRIRIIRPDLELLLRDKKTQVRISAALALGLLGDPRSTEPLRKTLADHGSEIQDAAVLSLGMVNDSRALDTLILLLGGGPRAAKLVGRNRVGDQRRATAAIALGLTRSPDALPPLLIAAGSRSEAGEVRAAAVTGLGLLDLPECEGHLLKILNQKKTRIQIKALAVSALGRIGGVGARAVLLKAMRSKKTEVRRAAALALGFYVPLAPVTEKYERALQNRRDARGTAPEALRKLDAYIMELEEAREEEQLQISLFDAARCQALRVAAAGDSEAVVRQFAVIALGQVGGFQDRSLLFRVLADEYLDTRPYAALALGILGRRGEDENGSVARALLAEFKRERRLDHKIAFALALGLGGWEGAAPPLLEAFKSTTEPLSRSYYAISLSMMGHSGSLEEVVKTLAKVRNEDEVQQSAMAYGFLASARSAEYLAGLLKRSKDRHEVMGAGVALALFGRSEDLRLLSGYIRNPDIPADTRAFIIEGIGMAGDVRDPSPLARLSAAHNFYLGFQAIDRAIQRKW